MKYLFQKISIYTITVTTILIQSNTIYSAPQVTAIKLKHNDPFYKAWRITWHGVKTLAGLASIGYGVTNIIDTSKNEGSFFKFVKRIFNKTKSNGQIMEMSDRFEIIQNTFIPTIFGFKMLKSGIKGLEKEFSSSPQTGYTPKHR